MTGTAATATNAHQAAVDARIAAAGQATARAQGRVDSITKDIERATRHGFDPTSRQASLAAAQETLGQALAVQTDAEQAYDGWSRFFLVQGGHIHRTTSCVTCNRTGKRTRFGWLTDLSGLTEAEAVAAHGAILCTVCFPSAPVEWTNKYELDAAAKAAAKCPGQADWDKPRRTGYVAGNWATCSDCGGRITTTPTGKLRAHKPA